MALVQEDRSAIGEAYWSPHSSIKGDEEVIVTFQSCC